MASEQYPNQTVPDISVDPLEYWTFRYQSSHTPWHLDTVSSLLQHHFNRLNPDGNVKNVLYPMCGMSLDLEWLADEKGLHVVGVDIAENALRKVVARSTHEWTESPVESLGPDARLFERKDGKMKLYAGDMFNFSSKVSGKFDAICDRLGLHDVEPERRTRYAEMLKEVLKPDGKLLVEAVNYDPKDLDGYDIPKDCKVPPPYSIAMEDMTSMFDPACTVEHIDRNIYKMMYGNDANFNIFIVVKQ